MLKKLAAVCAAASALFVLSASEASAGINDFGGQWVNQNSDTDDVTRVSVQRTRTGLRVNVFGRCHPTDCDWGAVNATAFASRADSINGSKSPARTTRKRAIHHPLRRRRSAFKNNRVITGLEAPRHIQTAYRHRVTQGPGCPRGKMVGATGFEPATPSPPDWNVAKNTEEKLRADTGLK